MRPLDVPAISPAAGGVVLRPFATDDVAMLRDLATDPYVPLIGSLPALRRTLGATRRPAHELPSSRI